MLKFDSKKFLITDDSGNMCKTFKNEGADGVKRIMLEWHKSYMAANKEALDMELYLKQCVVYQSRSLPEKRLEAKVFSQEVRDLVMMQLR